MQITNYKVERTKHRFFDRWKCSFKFDDDYIVGFGTIPSGAIRDAMIKVQLILIKKEKQFRTQPHVIREYPDA